MDGPLLSWHKFELTARNEVVIGPKPLSRPQRHCAQCLDDGQIDVPHNGPPVQPRLLPLPLWILLVVHKAEQHEGYVISVGNALEGREQISHY